MIFRDRVTTEAELCAGRQSSAATRWPAAGRTPEVETEKSEELGEKNHDSSERGDQMSRHVHACTPAAFRSHARS